MNKFKKFIRGLIDFFDYKITFIVYTCLEAIDNDCTPVDVQETVLEEVITNFNEKKLDYIDETIIIDIIINLFKQQHVNDPEIIQLHWTDEKLKRYLTHRMTLLSRYYFVEVNRILCEGTQSIN